MTEENTNNKKDNRRYIKVYKEFMEDNKYDSRDQFILLMLKSISHQRLNDVSIAGVDVILSILGFTTTSRNKASIKESLESLIEYGLIRMYKDYACTIEVTEVENWNTYFFKVTDGVYEDGYFTKVYYEDLDKFLKMDDKYKMKIFSVYYNIVSRMYDLESSDKFTLPKIEEISEETGVNRKTIPRYLKTLMENKLIYYKAIKNKKSKVKNVYSRWEDRSQVDRVVIEREGKY